MRIIPLSPPGSSTYSNLLSWSRKLGISLITKPCDVENVVLIGNGTPDDIVLMILLNKHNGKDNLESCVGIAKSKRLLEGSIKSAVDIVDKSNGKVSCILIAIDQEKNSLDDLWSKIERKLSELASYNRVEDWKRLKIYDCRRGARAFKLIIIINGIENQKYRSHTIEDHLLEVAIKVMGEERISQYLAESNSNPKKVWSRLSKKEQQNILQEIKNSSMNALEDSFEWHIKAINALKHCKQI